MRPSNRKSDELRNIIIEPGISRHAEGSCLISCGNTRIICTASVDAGVPSFLKGTGKGWITAEYGMLPRSTNSRMPREAAKGKQSGRTQEIQRLIGRSLRSIVDLSKLGEKQIIIDCDVIEADGGTRTASITGSYVALQLAIRNMISADKLVANPIMGQVAAVSCGVCKGVPVLDLDYEEDSAATMDANFILAADGRIIEVQCTAEQEPVAESVFHELMGLAKKGVSELAVMQNKALGI